MKFPRSNGKKNEEINCVTDKARECGGVRMNVRLRMKRLISVYSSLIISWEGDNDITGDTAALDIYIRCLVLVFQGT